jgi:DUF2945 family protein
MPKQFKVGDHVSWNFGAGHASGRIIKVHANDFLYKGYMHHATKEDPHMKLRVIKPITLPRAKGRR